MSKIVLTKSQRKAVEELVAEKLKKAMSRKTAKNVTIDIKYIMEIGDKQGWCCAISGVPLQFDHGVGGKNPYILTIDRKDSSKGYIKRNVQLVTWQVNQAKGEYPTKLLIEMCKNILKEAA